MRSEICHSHDHNIKSARNRDRLCMPTATQLAVFYATASKILRRKVIPDDDAQLRTLPAPSGESMLLMPLALPYDDAACRAAIAAATGVTPPSGRCCIVHDSGDIIEVCNADPTLDSHPQGKIIASESAGLGDRYIDGVFLRQYALPSRSSKSVLSTAWLPIVDLPPVPSMNVFRTATAHQAMALRAADAPTLDGE
jgi:hypothetical protein